MIPNFRFIRPRGPSGNLKISFIFQTKWILILSFKKDNVHVCTCANRDHILKWMCISKDLWWPVGCYNSEKVGNHWPGLSLEARKENKIVQILSQSKLCLCQVTHAMLASGHENAAAHTRRVSRSPGFIANYGSQRPLWMPCINSTSCTGNQRTKYVFTNIRSP